MRIWKSSACLVLVSTAFCARGADLPLDLDQLQTKWHGMDSQDNTDAMSLEVVRLEPDQNSREIFLQEEVNTGITAAGSMLTAVKFETFRDDSRKAILGEIFPDKSEPPTFCRAFVAKPVKPKEGEVLSDAQLKAKQAKADLAACKRELNKAMGGIFHADPTIHALSLTVRDQGSKAVMYVRSLVEHSTFLKYVFTI